MASQGPDTRPTDLGFDLGPVPDRTLVDAGRVVRLVASQFSQWAGLEVRPVPDQGWDNQTFGLGAELLVRLPTAKEYALAVEKEHRWLPELAPQLPLSIPEPLAMGTPSPEFPHPWSVYRWIHGDPVAETRPSDLRRLAVDLADFLTALRGIDPTEGPSPGVHNWFRGGPLRTYESTLVGSLTSLGDRVDANRVHEVWQAALDAPWDRRARWFHGDIATGNLLVTHDRLAAVIDFGQPPELDDTMAVLDRVLTA